MAAPARKKGFLRWAFGPGPGRKDETHPAGIPRGKRKIASSLVGPYELRGRIGSGGMGTVYRARNLKTGKIVALKILPKEMARDARFRQRFVREANLAVTLRHENLVEGMEFGSCEGSYYCAMEFVPGWDCQKIINARGMFEEREAVAIAAQVASAIEYASSHDLVHRDIKPANIILDPQGNAKLTDLGLTRSYRPGRRRITRPGFTVGSPHYLSPEQARGRDDLDVRSDIFSLGATLYHMVTGVAPFDAETPALIVGRRLTEKLLDPREYAEVSAAFVRALERMMARAREDRYPDARSVRADLQRILSGGKPLAEELDPELSTVENRDAPSEEEAFVGTKRLAAILLPLFAGLVLGLGIGAAAFVSPAPEKEPPARELKPSKGVAINDLHALICGNVSGFLSEDQLRSTGISVLSCMYATQRLTSSSSVKVSSGRGYSLPILSLLLFPSG